MILEPIEFRGYLGRDKGTQTIDGRAVDSLKTFLETGITRRRNVCDLFVVPYLTLNIRGFLFELKIPCWEISHSN